MVRLIVCGACGKMGSKILELANQNSNFQIVGAIESESYAGINQKIVDGKIQVRTNLESLKNSSDVLIDFTTPQATLSHLNIIQNWKKISAVIGTTGFSDKEFLLLKKAAKKIPIVLSPNMSVGVNLMFQLVRTIARKLSDYDIELIEAHHNQKKDAPSGTALALAKEISDELNRNFNQDIIYGRKGDLGARKPKEIGVHAIRAGDIVGEHTAIFAGNGERLELVHRATCRDAFASGALRAARWVYKRRPALYSMQDVLGRS